MESDPRLKLVKAAGPAMYEKNSAETAMLIASIVALKSIQEHLKISTKSWNLPEPQTFENDFFSKRNKDR